MKPHLAAIMALATMGWTPLLAKEDTVPASGDLRVTGASELERLLAVWRTDFEVKFPGVRVVGNLKGRASAIYGLEVRTADIALMDRALNPFERYGTYERSWTYPVELQIGTGGSGSAVGAYAVYVHPHNPIRQLTLEQLDGIFGARRDGGWDKLAWNKAAARGDDRDLRQWGQLGLAGRMRGLPIHPYGPAIEGQGAISAFQVMVLQGSAKWAEDYREYGEWTALFDDLAKDPAGIAYAPLGVAPRGWVPVSIAADRHSPFVAPTPKAVADRSYPLARPIYLYFTIDNASGDPQAIRPLVRAFARHVLSETGQAALARASGHYPLPRALIEAQLVRLESDVWPQERPKP